MTEIINETKDQIDLLCDGVKVTFFNAKWEFLEPPIMQRFNVASIEFIAKEKMTLNDIFFQAKNVIEGITYIDDLEDDSIAHLEPLKFISKEDIRDFFEEKIRE